MSPLTNSDHQPIAALDIGTNSAHLVIAAVKDNGNHLQIIDTEKINLRLGEAIDAKGFLSKQAILRTIAAIKQMKEICEPYTGSIRAVATHATRVAHNHIELISKIKEAVGVDVEIIDGIEEGRLTYLGISQGLETSNCKCVSVDIGGGSTEVVIGTGPEIDHISSIKIGAVTLTKRFLSGPDRNGKAIQRLEKFITQRLAPLISQIGQHELDIAVASSGTAKALANICSQMFEEKPLKDSQGYQISGDELSKIYSFLKELGSGESIAAEFELDQNRSDIILAGAAILQTLNKLLKIEEWTISTYGLREGVVLDTYYRTRGIKNPEPSDIRWRNVISFGRNLGVETNYSEHICKLSSGIFDELCRLKIIKDDLADLAEYRELLLAAAYLCEVGKLINHSRFHRHSYYILSSSNLMGYNQDEKRFIGLIARFQRKSVPTKAKIDSDELFPYDLRTLKIVSACLRLSLCLNRTRRNRIADVVIELSDEKMRIDILSKFSKDEIDTELYKAEFEKAALEYCLGYEIEFQVKNSR